MSARSFRVNQQSFLIDLIMYYTLFIGFFIYNFNVPSSVLYFTDFLNLVLILTCINKLSKMIFRRDLKIYTICIFAMGIVGILSSFVYGFHAALVLWSIRNWGRAIAFFLCCCCAVTEKQVKRMIEFFKKLFHINTIVIILQFAFFSSRYFADSLNGLFGRDTSSVNITFLMIVLSIVLSEYFSGRIKPKVLMLYLVEISVVAVIAELKALLFFEAIFFVVYAIVNSKTNIKKIVKYAAFCAVVFVGIIIASKYLIRLYPSFANDFSLSGLIAAVNNEKGYGFVGYIDRLNFVSVISKRLFSGNLWRILFGIGTGNGEYSAVSMFTSDFYNTYGNLFRYLNFSSSAIFTEVGLIGLVLFFLAFISLFGKCTSRIRKKSKHMNLFYDNVGLGVSLTTIVFILYNNLQRTDASFVLSFFLAIPFARKISRKNITNEELIESSIA